jgi:hypothetical protein
MAKTLADYQTNPALIDAALASNPATIPEAMAVSILKSPLVQAWILKQIADTAGSPS